MFLCSGNTCELVQGATVLVTSLSEAVYEYGFLSFLVSILPFGLVIKLFGFRLVLLQ